MKRLVCSLKLCNLLFLETFCMEKMSFFFLPATSVVLGHKSISISFDY